MSGVTSFQSGETSSIPGACVPRVAGDTPLTLWHLVLLDLRCQFGTANGEPAGTTDEKPALASAGLTDQVALRRSCPPSSLPMMSPRDLDDSHGGCPIPRTSVNHGPQLSSYAH
jgi:hypothetical protein